MRRLAHPLSILSFVLLTFISAALAVPTASATGSGGSHGVFGDDHKIMICHATHSATQPYTHPTIDVSAADSSQGHDHGRGDHYSHDDDIIPPSKTAKGGDVAGHNWTAEGQAIWNNGCNIPSPTTTAPPQVTTTTVAQTTTTTTTVVTHVTTTTAPAHTGTTTTTAPSGVLPPLYLCTDGQYREQCSQPTTTTTSPAQQCPVGANCPHRITRMPDTGVPSWLGKAVLWGVIILVAGGFITTATVLNSRSKKRSRMTNL